MRGALGAIVILAIMAMSGCSNTGLRDLRTNSAGPDEFMVMPVKPLTQPKDYAVLPAPTPGSGNLVDHNPNADAVASLGGRPSALEATGIPASDGALVTAASRNGVSSDIRQSLAEEDAAFRKRQSRLTRIRLFRVDRYDQAYRRYSINPFPVARSAAVQGASTPTAPPEYD